MSEKIRIERLSADSYRLTLFDQQAGAEVHVSLSPEAGARRHGPYRIESQSLELSGLPAGARHYFHIDSIPTVLSNRHIALQGTPNFRDFGGYLTTGSHHVRWGKLYRSGSLGRLTDEDLAVLEALNIAAVCDFRHDDERAHDPSRWPDVPHTQHLHMPLSEGDHATSLKDLLAGPNPVTLGAVVELMASINRDFVVKHSEVYARVLDLVLETDGPVLIHCAAGKDRTGFGAAVILGALGVPRDTIMKDYMLTAEYLVKDKELDQLLARYNLGKIPREAGAALFGVKLEYLNAAFAAIDSEFGSLDTYLREELGFDEVAQRELRRKLLV